MAQPSAGHEKKGDLFDDNILLADPFVPNTLTPKPESSDVTACHEENTYLGDECAADEPAGSVHGHISRGG